MDNQLADYKASLWHSRPTEVKRNGVANSLYFLIKKSGNCGNNRTRENGDLLVTTDLSRVFRVTDKGEVYAPEMKTVALQQIGNILRGVV